MAPRRGHHRRGRSTEVSHSIGQDLNSLASKPREERSFRDFHPELDVDAVVPILDLPMAVDLQEESVQSKQSRFADSIATKPYEISTPFRITQGYVDRGMVNLGFQESEFFDRPKDYYIRYIDSLESSRVNTVEYDMDEQDDHWLKEYNLRRKAVEGDEVSREVFEAAITKIEKEWFELAKRIPKTRGSSAPAIEDSVCNICDDGDCENLNAIIFCDGCNLAVHQDCYGVPYIPEGHWLCRKCQIAPQSPNSCIFCPNEGGPMKQTLDSQWAHVLCAFWIPEVWFRSPDLMEPIEGLDLIPKSRWKLTCYICQQKMGACVQCANKSCFTAFHVTCARRAKLCLQMKLHLHLDSSALKGYCDKHTPHEYLEKVDVLKALADAQRYYSSHTRFSTQSAVRRPSSGGGRSDGGTRIIISLNRRNNSSSQAKAGSTILIPDIVLRSVTMYFQKFPVRRQRVLATELCKFWTLKRESKRGASLLKRLGLMLEAESNENYTAQELLERFGFTLELQKDLEKLRSAIDSVRVRERQKLDRAILQSEFVEKVYFPIQQILSPILEKLDA